MVHWKWKRWAVMGLSLLTFVVGVATGRLIKEGEVHAKSDQIYELRIYHAVPNKLATMESRFRDKTSRILARHNLNVLGYWITEDASANSFVFLLAHQSRDSAEKNWEAVRLDPEFQEVRKSEQAEKTLEKADIIWLRPTDFSQLK